MSNGRLFTTKAKLLEILNDLPDETVIISQVVPQDGYGAWYMEARLSGVLENFNWENPVAALTMSHRDLLHLPFEGAWKEEME